MGKNKQPISFLYGFAITLMVVLLIRIGVSFILLIIGSFKLPSEVLVIYTSIFYGIVFLIARAGVRIRNHRLNQEITDGDQGNETERISKKNSIISGTRTFLWVFFGAFSVFWLTPALVIYWSSPIHPEKITALLGSLFGLASAAIYFAIKNERFPKIIDRLLFLIGICLGLLLAYWIVSPY